MNTSIYNNKIRAAKARIWQVLQKEGIETIGVKHKKLISIYFNMFDIQRPIEMRWQDVIIKLYENGDLPELERKKRTVKKYIPEYKQEYINYLNSKQWRTFRKEALNHFGNKCGLCTSEKKLQLHHKTYKNIFKETFEDVIPLCEQCHKRHHKK